MEDPNGRKFNEKSSRGVVFDQKIVDLDQNESIEPKTEMKLEENIL